MCFVIRLLFVVLLGVFAIGCVTQKKTSTTSSAGTKYSEDLSALRPAPEVASDTNTSKTQEIQKKKVVEAKYTSNKQLDAVLDSIDRINLRRNFIDGFTIQVYSGLKREDALNTKKMLTSSLPDLESEIQYTQPNFRVKVGTYYDRMDAQRDYVAIKKYFPTAIIIPDKVAIN